MKRILYLWGLIFFLFALAGNPYATVGVGVGTGKIQVDEKLASGMSYQFPSLMVFNTGDEPSDYEVGITYHQNQTQRRPKEEWFSFSPQKFHLDPGQGQEVKVKVTLPLKTAPGDYFAYLEGRPAKQSKTGETRVGVAAAAKLYFTVKPANTIQAIYYRLASWWKLYAPWPQRISAILAAILLFSYLKKFFKIQISFKKSSKGSTDE